MKLALALLFYLAISVYGQSQSLPSFYHTTASIYKELEDLQYSCENDIILETLIQEPKIHLVTITKKDEIINMDKKQKVFYLFGEHPRELISPETGLNIVNTLCGKAYMDPKALDDILTKNVFQFVINANPIGRMMVEDGEPCQRTNEHGVDLNRNWDDHWEHAHDNQPDVNPGIRAFSEVESLKVKDALEKFKPHVFATIHSGALGMYTPYAYKAKEAEFNENEMLRVLNTLNDKYCGCDVGAAGDKVGYLCPGTCLDYAYDRVKVPYTFAFEIYSVKKQIPALFQYTSFLQLNSRTLGKKGSEKPHLKEIESCFLQTSMKTSDYLTRNECFLYFNPTDRYTYDTVVDNWTKALLELTHHVFEHRQTVPQMKIQY